MKTAVARLKGISPYSQSRHYTEPAKGKTESSRDYEARTWRERLHSTEDGRVFMPPMAFKNCLSEAAKFLSVQVPGKGKATFTKHFEAGVLVVDGLILPQKKAEVPGEWNFVPADGKRGGGKRVEKCFPVIHHWEGDVRFIILDETITQTITVGDGETTAFEHHLKEAGSFIGVGRFRPRNNGYYGRFIVEGVRWE